MKEAICCYSNEESVINSSSSGGIAYAISYDTIIQGGVVYGVSYTDDYKGARHIRVDNTTDLKKLSGSKYVKPIDSLNWGGVLADISCNRFVTVIGLPCEIAGLKKNIEAKHLSTEKLLLVDLVCGGTTPSSVLQQYVDSLEKKYASKVISLSVRYKNPNWTPPFLLAEFSNGKVYLREFYKTVYGYAFENYKNKSCYNCCFKDDNHMSDITIGDAWGIKNGDAAWNSKGVSVCFIHSKKGYEKIKQTKGTSVFPVDFEYYKENNPRYYLPKEQSAAAKKFADCYESHGLFGAYKKTVRLKSRVKNALPNWIMNLIEK